MALKRWWKRTLIGAGIVLIPIAVLIGVFVLRFIPFPPEADYPPPVDRIEAFRQDLDFLRRYPDYDWTFTDSEESAFRAAIDELESRLDTLTPAQFELGVARAVALANNAHTNISPISRRARVDALPLRLAWFADGLYVVMADEPHTELLGARVVRIEQLTPDELVDVFRPYFGGYPGRARWISTLNMESPELLHAAGITPQPKQVDITFALESGAEVVRTIAAIEPFTDRAMRRYGGGLLQYVVPAPAEATWRHVMQGATPPTYLSRPDDPFFAEWIETSAGPGLYMSLAMTMDVGEHSLSDFHARVLADLDKRHAQFVVVDLRHNGGGTVDPDFSKGVVSRLASDGHVFILTSPETFSGGITEAAYLKHFGGDRALVIGEPVGDHLVFWANGGTPMVLPNSRISVYVWVSKEDWEKGCDDWWECFWPTMLTDVGVGTLEPDVPVSLSFADYRAGRDPAMDNVIAIVEARHFPLGLSAPAIAEPSLRPSQQAFLADSQPPEPLAPLAPLAATRCRSQAATLHCP